ncbi:hypothetical protein QQ045_000072 [Rhodiola kirilowii]
MSLNPNTVDALDGQGRRGYLQGAWDAIHVIQVAHEEEGSVHYCLTSTIMLSLTTADESSGTFSLSGSIRRQVPVIACIVGLFPYK